MNKADKIFRDNILDIMVNGVRDENPRPRYESDGEPAHSVYITQVYEKYDIGKGEFPITTLRPITISGAIKEMLAIYQTQTNTQEGFESHDIKWWSPWMNEEGNIGRAYAYNLESHRPNEMNREVVKVERRIIDEKYGEIKDIGLVNPIEKSIDGVIYFEDSKSPFIITNNRVEKTENGTYKYEIQFINTGYKKLIRGNDLNQSIKHKKELRDNYARNYYGVGFLGDYKSVSSLNKEQFDALIVKWESIMKRCYGNQGAKNEKNYKDKNIFVHQEWHSLENFLRDVRFLPHYHLAKEDNFKGWDLDKDYYGGNCYSNNTCVFLKHQENVLYSRAKPLSIIDKSNSKEKIFIDLIKASEYIGVSHSALKTALHRDKLYKGIYKDYLFNFIENDNEILYRYELSRNQINELLKNLKEDSYNRRHMLSFFNWSNQDKKMLVECAFQSLLSVRNVGGEQYLDFTLIMRSSDYLVAGHINQLQYVALQMMIAKHVGMKVGTFARFTQNLHIYERHFEQAQILLDRTPSEKSPILKLNVPDGTNFYDINYEDFELVDYEPVKPQLKFELGI